MKKLLLLSLIPALIAAGPVLAQEEGQGELENLLLTVMTTDIANSADVLPRSPELIGGFGQFFRAADYPPQSWVEGEEGYVTYDVDVDSQGEPSDCQIVKTSGFPRLDVATCSAVMERASYRPAMDEDGRPVAGSVEGGYFWGRLMPEFRHGSITLSYLVDEAGDESDCEVIEFTPPLVGGPILDSGVEDFIAKQGCPSGPKNVPYRDENGIPVAKRVVFTMSVELEDAQISPRD